MTKSENLSRVDLPVIETDRLKISPLTADHADGLFEPFSDPDLYPYIFLEIPESTETLRTRFERICVGKSKDGKEIWLNWVAVDKATGQYSGFYEATIEESKAFLAYYTFKPFQRKGYAKEGMFAVMAALDARYDLDKFVLEMDTRNRASVKLAETLGFHWVDTINNACEFKGFQSHEFRFEKGLRTECRLIKETDAVDYIKFRYPDKLDDERRDKTTHLLANFKKHVSDYEKVFVCFNRNEVVGSACLLQFQPGSFRITNLTIKGKDYENTFSCLISKIVNEVYRQGGKRLEYRLIEGDKTASKIRYLEKAKFNQTYHRTEFKRQLSDLEGDHGTPLTWRALTNLTDKSLKNFAEIMASAAQGDPDFHPDDDAYECVKGYLEENDLTHGEECFHIGQFEGADAAIVIAQVDEHNGWSRITYMGLLPEFRGRGLGKWVHRHGFKMMKDQGVTYYHGGTLTNNKPMMKLFEKHGCKQLRTMQGWVLDISSTSTGTGTRLS